MSLKTIKKGTSKHKQRLIEAALSMIHNSGLRPEDKKCLLTDRYLQEYTDYYVSSVTTNNSRVIGNPFWSDNAFQFLKNYLDSCRSYVTQDHSVTKLTHITNILDMDKSITTEQLEWYFEKYVFAVVITREENSKYLNGWRRQRMPEKFELGKSNLLARYVGTGIEKIHIVDWSNKQNPISLGTIDVQKKPIYEKSDFFKYITLGSVV